MKNIIPLIILLFLASSCSQKRYSSIPKIKGKKIVQNKQRTIKQTRVIIPSVVLSPVKALPKINLRDSMVTQPIPTTVTVAQPANIYLSKNTTVKKSRSETVKIQRTTKSAGETDPVEDNNRLKKILKTALRIILVAGLIILIIKIVPATTLAIIVMIIGVILCVVLIVAVIYYCLKFFLDFVMMMGGN